MKLSKFFRPKRHRGKSKSPEVKFREKKAKVDSFLMDSWLRQLKSDPELANRIAEQRFGSEAIIAQSSDGEYEPDLLSVLRQAREAKDLLRDELSEGKGSTIRDIAEVIKALPSALSALQQINPAQFQQLQQHPQVTQPKFQQISEAQINPEVKSQPPNISEIKLEKLMPLLELEPSEALQNLEAEGEVGWLNYLATTTYEQLEQTLRGIGEANPEFAEHITNFLKQKHRWLEQLVELAHQTEQK